MNLPETFYIALCVTILMLGAIYWFWTQLQYLQRKVNLLDNVVYEMKTLVSNLPAQAAAAAAAGVVATGPSDLGPAAYDSRTSGNTDFALEAAAPYAPPPESVAGDLEAERMASELEFDSFSGAPAAAAVETAQSQVPDELQPGGLASGESKKVSDTSIESPLASMSIKDLRRMAEANGIPGSSELKKRDLIRSLRDKVSTIVNPGSASVVSVDDGPKIISFDDIAAPDGE
jgi:hypothetical protein